MADNRLVWSDNFFSKGDNSKIIFPTIGFSSWQLKKLIFMILRGFNGSLGAFWAILGLKRAILSNKDKLKASLNHYYFHL